MSRRSVTWLAWALCAPTITCCMGLLLLAMRSGGIGRLRDNQFLLANVVLAVAFPVVGALVAARQPGNRIAWVFLFIGVGFAVSAFLIEYAFYALIVAPSTLPGGVAAAWLGSWLSDTSFFAIPLIPLLFPDGRLPGRRWRPVAWALAALLAVDVVVRAFAPGPIRGGGSGIVSVNNPLGIAALAGVIDVVEEVGLPSLLLSFIASLATAVVRGRHARGAEYQQFKWFAFGVAGLPVAVVFEVIFPALVWAISAASAAFLAIALGVAILRYRLYEIDLIIRRTLVYGVLTAMLAFLYLSTVALLQFVSRALTDGGGQQPQWAIVASTLGIAALFQPLRRRIQGFIDRRFYRRKYDAARTLEEFATRLRDEVELDVLRQDLIGVVQETLQPEHVSLWLRDPGR